MLQSPYTVKVFDNDDWHKNHLDPTIVIQDVARDVLFNCVSRFVCEQDAEKLTDFLDGIFHSHHNTRQTFVSKTTKMGDYPVTRYIWIET